MLEPTRTEGKVKREKKKGFPVHEQTRKGLRSCNKNIPAKTMKNRGLPWGKKKQKAPRCGGENDIHEGKGRRLSSRAKQ